MSKGDDQIQSYFYGPPDHGISKIVVTLIDTIIVGPELDVSHIHHGVPY